MSSDSRSTLFSRLAKYFKRERFDIDQALEHPELLTDEQRALILREQEIWDVSRFPSCYPHKILTAHGHVIVPYRVNFTKTSLSSNLIEFASQPRMKGIYRMLKPAIVPETRSTAWLDQETGQIFASPDGVHPDRSACLGVIDPKTETSLFDHALERLSISRVLRAHQARPGF